PYRAPWWKKIIAESNEMGEDCHMVDLIPAKPGTGYFQDIVAHARAVVFIRGRLTFVGAPDPAPFESALVYHGDRPVRFVEHFKGLGWAVVV
ncbi:MAG TPA: hypothetical protein VFH61_10795, partial [Thermoleophilia bacterium]|nr:hypothetical protein [Thermoleophilia bacterium]